MPHVDIQASRIGQKAAIAGRLIMASMMEVHQPSAVDLERCGREYAGPPTTANDQAGPD